MVSRSKFTTVKAQNIVQYEISLDVFDGRNG